MIVVVQSELHTLGETIEVSVKRCGDEAFVGRRGSQWPCRRVLVIAVTEERYFGPIDTQVMSILLSEGGHVDDRIALSVRKLPLEPDVLLELRVVAQDDFAHLALLAGAETHAELVIRERAHLGAHAEVLVDAEILVDAAGEISRLLQLRWAHARSGVPDDSLPHTVNLTGGPMHNLLALAP